MADFTAMKGCRFGGTVYKAGDIIPEAAVNPKRVRHLTALGIIRAVVEVQQEPPQEAKATKGKEEHAKNKKAAQKAGGAP